MNFVKKHKLASFFIVLLIGAGIAFFVVWKKKESAVQNFVAIKKGSIVEAIYGIGTVKANKIFDLRVGVASTIDKLFVDEGNFVKKGAALASLAGLKIFYAPFSGTISKVQYQENETIYPQASILTLTDLSDRYVSVSIEQEGIIKVLSGQKARLSFESLRDTSFHGVVENVYASDGRFLVRINTADLPAAILPGMTADVSITISIHKDVWLVPVAAITDKKIKIKHKNSQEIEEIPIDIKLIDGDLAEISSDKLRAGDAALSP